jgi:hypothetical protein
MGDGKSGNQQCMNQIVRREIEIDASTVVNLRLDSGVQAMRSTHGTIVEYKG